MSGPRITQMRVLRVMPQKITSNGNDKGRITVPNSDLFMVNQIVTLKDNTGARKDYQIKRIVDRFVYLGEKGKGIADRSDVSQWAQTNGTTIEAREQDRPKTPVDQTDFFEHAEEPISAKRTIGVDLLGRYMDPLRYDVGEVKDGCLPGGEPAQRSQLAPPFSYIYLATAIQNILGTAQYDSVESTVEGDIEVLTFRLQNQKTKKIEIRYNGCTWEVGEFGTLEGVIVQEEDATPLLTEAGETISIQA